MKFKSLCFFQKNLNHEKTLLLFDEDLIDGNTAGSKARNDFNKIAVKKKIKSINKKKLPVYDGSDNKFFYFIKKIWITFIILIRLRKVKGKFILIQYPININSLISTFIIKRILKRNEICCFVHDIESIRKNDCSIKNEIEILNKSSAIILHNKIMKEYMCARGLNVPNIIVLELFDYLLNNRSTRERKLSREIVFAGNLEKSKFIKKLKNIDITFKMILYGPGFIPDKEDVFIQYEGSYPPEILPDKIKGSFGLIWDGGSINTCSGNFGDYMRYNNPHKLSLYIAAGLPVIVWKEAAVSDFIEKNRIGFSVNSLLDIKGKLEIITEIEYKAYINNIELLRDKVRSGYYTSHAIDRVLSAISRV